MDGSSSDRRIGIRSVRAGVCSSLAAGSADYDLGADMVVSCRPEAIPWEVWGEDQETQQRQHPEQHDEDLLDSAKFDCILPVLRPRTHCFHSLWTDLEKLALSS